MTEAIANEEKNFPQYFTALEENKFFQIENSLNEIQAFSDSVGTIPFANPQRNKFSVDDGFKTVKAAVLAVKQSFRSTDTQEAAIQKCFLFVKEDDEFLNARMLKEKNKRFSQIREMFRSVREMLNFQGFLFCAFVLTPKKIQAMTKADATNFPFIFKRWWDDFSFSSERLIAITETLKTLDERIPYIFLVTANEVHQIFRNTKPLKDIDAMVDLFLQKKKIKNNY